MTFDLKAGNGWMFKSGRGRHEQIEVIVLDKMSAHGQARAAILRGPSPCKVKQLGLNTFYNVFQPTKIERATVSIYDFVMTTITPRYAESSTTKNCCLVAHRL